MTNLVYSVDLDHGIQTNVAILCLVPLLIMIMMMITMIMMIVNVMMIMISRVSVLLMQHRLIRISCRHY